MPDYSSEDKHRIDSIESNAVLAATVAQVQPAWVTGEIDDWLRQKLEYVPEADRDYRPLLARPTPPWIASICLPQSGIAPSGSIQ